MLNLALVGLLAGSLVTSGPTDDKGKDKDRSLAPPAVEAVASEAVASEDPPSVLALEEPADPRTVTSDTYFMGRPSQVSPFRAWINYGRGQSREYFDLNGQNRRICLGDANPATATCDGPTGTQGEIRRQTLAVGAHVDLLNFPAFKVGVGAQLNVGQTEFQADAGQAGLFAGGLESSFGLQAVKVYGQLRGRVVGIHGGYQFDLGTEQTFTGPVPNDLSTSDERNAINLGADFDYPSERFRLFGGIDFYSLTSLPRGGQFFNGETGNDDLLFFTMGGGVRFSVFELGAALGLRTQFMNGPLNGTNAAGQRQIAGGHIGFVNPYLRITPGFIPAALVIKTGALSEYTEYGFPIGGANEVRPAFGWTVGLALGFE